MQDFTVYKFYSYTGPNPYIDRQAMVFNVYIDPNGPDANYYRPQVVERFPEMSENYPDRVIDLFAKTLSRVFKMGVELFIRRYVIIQDEDEYIIAVEHLDDQLAKETAIFVSEWFISMNEKDYPFDFDKKYNLLQQHFNQTVFGQPSIYSLIEAAIKRKINVHLLYDENQFQWGYGKKQIRGRSTSFHTDSIKDTEFVRLKEKVSDWLTTYGFPTPRSKAVATIEDLVEEVYTLKFPVVVKPINEYNSEYAVTEITTEEDAIRAYQQLERLAFDENQPFLGVIVQKHIEGHDYRAITVGGKFAACLKRLPPVITGDGVSTIRQLIEKENLCPERIDNVRSPMVQICIDDDMINLLRKRGLKPDDILPLGHSIKLRKTGSISAGGVSVDATTEIHPENIEVIENLARFFHITALGIDILAADISKPWTEGNFGIIGLSSSPGVFMHQAPAIGQGVDVPGKIMEHFFGIKHGYDRIPIIAGNVLSDCLIEKIHAALKKIKHDLDFGVASKNGVFFNSRFITKSDRHDDNCMIVLRNPRLDFAVFEHREADIQDYGIWHQGMDVVILYHPKPAEVILKRDLLPDGLLFEISGETGNEHLDFYIAGKLIKTSPVNGNDKDELVFRLLEPYLKDLLFKYDYYLSIDNSPENLNLHRVFYK